MKKTYLLLQFSLLLLYNAAHAQSWQWGVHGGSSYGNPSGYPSDQTCQDVTTDKWGNVYVLSQVIAFNPDIDGVVFPVTSGAPYPLDLCISSYRCDGTLRWYKLFEGNDQTVGSSLKADTSGGIYVAGNLFSKPGEYVILDSASVDTSFYTWSSIFIAKFDTSGHYKWLRMPEPDTLTAYSPFSGTIDMDIDDAGNSYLLCYLKGGSYANGAFTVSDSTGYDYAGSESAYILKYNSNGDFQNGKLLPINETNNGTSSLFLKRDENTNHTYILGSSGDTYGDSTYIADSNVVSTYIACFDDNMNMIWLKHSVNNGLFGQPLARAALDDSGNIYISGSCEDGYIFGGHTFHDSISLPSSMAFLVKLDKNGNILWATNSNNTDYVYGEQAAVCGDTAALWGLCSAPYMFWDSDTMYSSYYQVFLARFNANNGKLIGIDSLYSPSSIYPGSVIFQTQSAFTADRFGNFYGVGAMTDDLSFGDDTLEYLGSTSNWFAVKFGTQNCSVPIISPAGVANNIQPDVLIFPNPATATIEIKNALINSEVRIYTIEGRLVYETKITDENDLISIDNFTPGSYLLQIINEANNYHVNKVIIKR